MTKKTDALVPVEQKQVLFYEDTITAVRTSDNTIFIPLRPLCERLGVAWAAQRRRINRDPVLSKMMQGVTVTVTPGGKQEMLCLPLDYLNGWMFGINAARVKEAVRDKLIRYQEQCYRVLHEAFQDGRLTADPDLEALSSGQKLMLRMGPANAATMKRVLEKFRARLTEAPPAS